jgi:hypothetical protein
MLLLLGVPSWQTSEDSVVSLPASLPVCLLIYLVCHGRWVDREALGTFFWPDRAPDEARHNLRVNLHRVRQLLVERGCETHLQSERSRVSLRLPSDLKILQAAIAVPDAVALAKFAPMQWLSSFRVAGFGRFFEWADALVMQLRLDWRAAVQVVLQTGSHETLTSPWMDALRTKLSLLEPDIDTPPDASRSVASAPHLVGRSTPLQTLRQIKFRAVLLTGEAGLGKSTLLAAAFQQVPTLYGREGLTQIPYRSWMIFRQRLVNGVGWS